MEQQDERQVGGRFEILERLDRGGLSQVYRGFDHKEQKLVALKVMERSAVTGSNEDWDLRVERFKREVAILKQLASCPQVVDLIAAETDGPRPWLAMEYVSGSSLRALIDEAPEGMRLKRYLPIAGALVSGLRAIHAENIVHRDLAPDNVVLASHSQGKPRVKLLDFGIGKTLDNDKSPVTRMPTIMGKPAYLSPEQTRDAAVDKRSDIYALGVILYEMLVGQRPIDVSSFGEIARVRREEPKPFAAFPGSSRVPEELRNLIMRCLAKEPEERPGLQELGHVLLELEQKLDSGERLSAAFSEWEISRLRSGGSEPRGLVSPRQRIAETRAEWLLGGKEGREVWLGSHDGRDCALQLVVGDEGEAFLESMRRQKAIDHPNVLRVEDCGQEGEIYWARLELVRGTSLARVFLEEGAMAPGRILQIGQGLLDALAATPGYHAFLRPSSVLLDEFDMVKLTDFGFGKGPEDLDPVRATGTTAPWTAPERFRGQPVSEAAEIYALGCLFYQMIAGEPVFDGPDLSQAYQHMNYEPRPLEDGRASFEPKRLFEIVHRALRKEPERRQVSLAKLQAAFQAAFSESRDEESGELRPPPAVEPVEEKRSWFRRLMAQENRRKD